MSNFDIFLKELDKPLREPTRAVVDILNYTGPLHTIPQKDVKYVHCVFDIDPLCRRLPTEHIEIELIDLEKKYVFGEPGSIIENPAYPMILRVSFEQMHNNQYISCGEAGMPELLITETPVREGVITKIKAVGVLELMSKTIFYKSSDDLTPVSITAFAEKIAGDAGNFLEIPGYDGVSLDGLYSSTKVPERIGIMSHADALQIIAARTGHTLHSYGAGVWMEGYQLSPPGVAPAIKIRDSDIMKDSIQKVVSQRVKNVTTYYYQDRLVDNNTTMITEINPIAVRNVHVEYSPAAFISGHPDIDIDRPLHAYGYRCASDIEFNRETYNPNGRYEIGGRRLEEISKSVTRSYNVDGDTNDTIKNPLVTTYTDAIEISDRYANYYNIQNVWKLRYRGNPLIHTGNMISTVIDGHTKSMIVLSHDLEFDGTLHGSLVLKEMRDS